MRHIPNFISSLNLASGFAAIVFLFNGDPVTASWLILAAMIFDFFDGFAARLLKAYSDIGKELDSLADVVSFGVAPGLIIYTVLTKNTTIESSGILSIKYLMIIAVTAFFPVCAALRLAKFNIDTTQSDTFRGVPTPAAALAVVTVILSGNYSGSLLVNSFLASPAAVMIFSLIISVLMVTRIPLLSLKFHDFGIKGNEGRFLLIAVCALLVIIFRFGGIPWIIPAYLAVSIISLLFRKKV
jgi:CDP-diacylglycerol---serine O-phosphatidyltransferase